MTRGFLIVGAVALVLAKGQPNATIPPDFSGTWVLADPTGSSMMAKSFTITQDATTLSMDFSVVSLPPQGGGSTTTSSVRRMVYNLNGTESRETLPDPPPRQPNASPGLTATLVASVARAAWNGDQLVIVVHSTMKVTWPSQWPSQWPAEIDQEITTREAVSLDANGHLVVDRIVIVDPLPFRTSKRLDLPMSWKRIYKKAA